MNVEHSVTPSTQIIGGGEMGNLIREKNWTNHLLGPIEQWPKTLRTTLGLILNSRFPMFLFWGENLLCFYNDAYRPSLGSDGKHPDILGKKGEEAWPEVWSILKPLIDQVMGGGEATWSQDQLIPIFRNGRIEDVYWTFSYSPVFDDLGKITGVMVTCSETTQQVDTIKQLKTSELKIKNLMEETMIGIIVFDGPEMTVDIANEKALEIIGRDHTIIGKKLLEFLPEIKTQPFYELLSTVFRTGEIRSDEEAVFYVNKNDSIETLYVDFVFKPQYDLYGDIVGVVAMGMDVTDKVITRVKLEDNKNQLLKSTSDNEYRVRSIIDNAPFPIGVYIGEEMRIEYVNQSIIDVWGKGADVVGKTYAEVLPELAVQEVYPQLSQVYKTGIPYVAENRKIDLVVNGELKSFYFNYIFTPLRDAEGKIYGVMNTAADVTELNVAKGQVEEREKRFREVVRQAPMGITILRGPKYVVEMANELYLNVVGRGERDFVGRQLFDALPEVRETVEPLLNQVYHSGQPFYATEFPVVIERFGKRELTYFNFVYHPLAEENGEITGIMVVASDVTASVNVRNLLAESERQFRTLVMKSPTPMAIFRGREYIVEMANFQMFHNIWRKGEAEVLGRKLFDVFPEIMDQHYPELLYNVFTQGITYRESESLTYINGNDGLRKFYLDFECAPLFESDNTISGIIVTMNDVTEKVEARKKVEESEMRFRNIADNAPVLIWMTGADMKYSFFNRAWLNFTGRTLDAELRNNGIVGIHPDDAEKRMKIFYEAFLNKEDFSLDYRIIKYDGQYRWISESAVPRFTSDGDFEGYIGACKDIHERVMNRQMIKDNEERLNIVVRASELGTWELNLITSEVIYSDRYIEILGYPKGTVLTHEQIKHHLHSDDLPKREHAFRIAYETGVLNYQSRIIWNDNSIHWVEGRGKVFYNEEGKPAKMIGTVRDITDEKNYQQHLQEREQKFRLLADSMPQHIWTADTYGNFNYFNQSVYNYSGLSFEDLANDGWMQIIHPDDRQRNINLWRQSIETGRDFLFEHRFRRYDGVYHWQLSRAVPQRDETGRIQMWVGTSTDIQEQKIFTSELEKQVQERTRELEQKNKELVKMNSELSSFAYVSSHDLQEPLRKIQTFAARIIEKEKVNLTETGKDYFRRMQDAANRMQTLIDDLLAYSRTNNRDQIFKKVNLEEFFEDVKNEFRETLIEKEAVIDVNVKGELSVIPFQFRQLLQNIFGNALKFATPKRKPHIQVSSRFISGSELDNEYLLNHMMYCHLRISDNGIGFDPVYKERIFEVFQRLHGRDEYSGTGIGLAIVKKIVDNHNGSITADGGVDKGAVFDIYIPDLN